MPSDVKIASGHTVLASFDVVVLVPGSVMATGKSPVVRQLAESKPKPG
jgi:hypothetical protein